MRRTAACVLVAIALASAGARTIAGREAGGAGSVSEHAAKAALIYNFVKFVEWPANAGAGDHLDIDVVDDGALAAALQRLVDGKPAQGRTVVIRGDRHECDPEGHVCVIGSTGDGAIASQIARIKALPVLTIGDSPRFIQLGGIVQFRLADDRLRFRVNNIAAAANGLKISGRLLVLAEGQEHSR